MKPYYEHAGITIYHGDQRLIDLAGPIDSVITDPPFSERTHLGNDASANGHAGAGKDLSKRREIGYGWLTPADVVDLAARIAYWNPSWAVVFTDHSLASIFCSEFEKRDRYCFAPLPFYSPGRSVRLSGDGPCSWTDWIIASRLASASRWGTLPGGYIYARENSDRVGSKPLSLMKAIVKDYSREGSVVVDPYMGTGTTLRAAKELGRRAIGIEIEERYCEIAAKRLSQEVFDFTA